MSVLITPAGHLGDIPLSATFGFKFNSHAAIGTPIVLTGSPAVKVFKRGDAVEDDSGITLTVDYDSKVGLNDVVIDLSADLVFYTTGGDFTAVITAGTVDAVSAVGTVVASWSIGKGVDLTRIGANATSLSDFKDFVDDGYDPTTNMVAGALALGTQAKADVNAEVLDVLNVDTFAQPGQGAPPATTTMRLMMAYWYKNWRNRKQQTAAQWTLYNDDAATVDQKAAVSNDGTTAEKGEVATGP